jgi:transposase
MRKSSILFVRMDVHKESLEIALVEDGANGEVRRYGRIGGTFDAVKIVLRKLVSQGRTLHFYYEAGPCGYELYRYLTGKGHVCVVVAIARELAGFMRAIAQAVPLSKTSLA